MIGSAGPSVVNCRRFPPVPHEAALAKRPARLRLVAQSRKSSSEMSVGEPLSDKALVARAAKGDAIAFSELVTRHYRRALRVAFGLLKDKHDAEDVVQDAFTRVHRRLGEFEGASAFYTWLYRIVVNLSIDAIRRRRRERRVDIEDEAVREALRSGDEL